MRCVLRSVGRLAPSLALVLALACAGKAPEDNFYRLSVRPESPGGEIAALRGTVVVDRFRAEGLTRERAILYADASDLHRVRRHRYQFWVEPPAEMLQDQITTYLRLDGATGELVTPAPGIRADHSILGTVKRFERVLEGSSSSVAVSISFLVVDENGATVQLNRVYEAQKQADGRSVADGVKAFDAAVGEIFARFVADLRRL